MQTYTDVNFISDIGTCGRAVAIGVFDGVHLGHQHILKEAVRVGHSLNGRALVITFRPHPDAILRPQTAQRRLITLAYKEELLAALGIDELLVVKFDHEFAKLSPAEFCHQILSDSLQARVVLVGANFCFGHKGAGTSLDLQTYGREHGFQVKAIPLDEKDSGVISSTRIRRLIGQGKMAAVTALLGRPHRVEGAVVHGAGRGHVMGFPTANLEAEANIVLPAAGVYVTRSIVDKQHIFHSVTSIGTKPTFTSDDQMHIETFFLDQNSNVYGRFLCIDFLEYIREQKAFPNADSLVAQIQQDVEFARNYYLHLR